MNSKEVWKIALDDNTLLDSGNRTSYNTGAVRDIQDGKGRCDLLPLGVIGEKLESSTLMLINKYVWGGNIDNIWDAIIGCIGCTEKSLIDAVLDVAIHYEEGAKKYGERNWEKGIPAHSYIDSGVRHYLKYLRKDNDENHKRAFIWNMLGLIYTHNNKPELLDLPFNKKE